MTEPNDTTTLVERLQSVQSQLKAPKGQKNKFGNYNYRSAEDILEALKPLLASNGLALIITDDIVEIAGRVYVKASASVIDSYGAQIGSNGFAREAETKKGMDDAQITGSASSYARKYALNVRIQLTLTARVRHPSHNKTKQPMPLKGLSNMTQYDNTNKGGLWPSEQKTEKHPNLKGKINVDGKDYYLSAWSTTDKNGGKYLSLAVDKPIAKEPSPVVTTSDESLPF
jgi:hypothetical protein